MGTEEFKGLNKSVEEYPGSLQDRKIHPISLYDSEIFKLLYRIVERVGLDKFTSILKKYKEISDEDTYLELVDLEKSMSDTKENNFNQFLRYIKIDGSRLDLLLLISFDCFEDSSDKFCILINPTPDSAKNVPFYANRVYMFDKREDRDMVASKFDYFLEMYKGKFIQ